MNIVFWFGVVVAALIVWYLCSRWFFNIGRNTRGIVDEIVGELNKKEDMEETEHE